MTSAEKTDPGLFDWHDLLPPPFRDPAYLFGNEYAWPRDMALEVIVLLEQKQRHTIGVDTWIPTRPDPTMVVYDWDEHAHAKVPGFPSTPSEFVQTFTWKLGRVEGEILPPYFNLTVE